MKHLPTLALFASLFSAAPAMAATTLVKTCNANIHFPGASTQLWKTTIYKENDKKHWAKVVQRNDNGEETTVKDWVTVHTGEIRKNLNTKMDPDSLSLPEKFIAHAMYLIEDPELEKYIKLGFDLKNVRYARVYLVGPATDDGAFGIVEAYDKDKKLLGSYLGGLMVAACEK